MFSFDQLNYPLIQAPMAGGPNTAEMVSSVVNSGAVGSYGFAYSKPEVIDRDLNAARAMIRPDNCGAINANFFIFYEVELPHSDKLDAAAASIRDITGDSAVDVPQPPYFPDLTQQLEPIWEFGPDILTFHFGIPDAAIIAKARSSGIAVGITATCIDEAISIEHAGADFIVAQGIEAGGHRGIFNPAADDECLSTFDLLEALRHITSLPLVAAGSIMNSDRVRKALEIGANARQAGTAFLTTRESGASPAHKHYLLNKPERSTRITRGFSGRPARGITNRFIEEITNRSVLPFPLQNSLTGKMRARAVAENDGEFQSLWAGSYYAECREETINELLGRLFIE